MSIITRGSISDKYECTCCPPLCISGTLDLSALVAFHMWDEDNSGTLDKNEFEKFLRTSQGRDSLDPKLFEQIWASIDVDCDGHVKYVLDLPLPPVQARSFFPKKARGL